MSIAQKLIAIAENMPKVYEAGKSAGGYEQVIYNMSQLGNAWYNAVFPENTELVLKIKNVCNITSAFNNVTGLKSVKLIADNIPETAIIAVTSAFYACADIETIDLTEFGRKISAANHFVYNANKLKSILGALDMSACPLFSQTFGSGSLEDVEFVPNTIKISIAFNRCGNLTDKSIQSIIDGLADLTGGTTQTLDFSAGVVAKLTDEQWEQIINKNWSAI